MANPQPILNNVEDRTELTIDDLDAVTGGVWLDSLVDMVKAIVCYTNHNCTSHGTVLNKR